MIRAASPVRHRAAVAHGFEKTELRRRRAGPYSSTDGRQISECLCCAVLSSCFVELVCLQAINGMVIVSAFFQASLLLGMTIGVRLQVFGCSRLPADSSLTTTALHRVLECGDKD